jgi:hypothetical protein
MKIGLIARSEIARGIAIQSKNFFDNMPVDKVLLVRMPRLDCVEDPSWYPGRTDAVYDPLNHQLEEDLVRGWLAGLDIVFTVETPNDWRIPTWCREMGVRLVIQGNPEFVRHGQRGYEYMPHPDAWWWPSMWRQGLVPAGPVMPVPMPDDIPERVRDDDPRLHVVHVIGKLAFADRNGTDLFAQAIPQITRDIKLTIHCIDGGLHAEMPRHRPVEMQFQLEPVVDRWEMYQNQDLLMLPRRYGGLCLPALEAAASGLMVAMSDISPNEHFTAHRFGGTIVRNLNLAAGPVPCFDSNPTAMARMIDQLADLHDDIEWDRQREMQMAMVPRWSEWRQRYLDEMERML